MKRGNVIQPEGNYYDKYHSKNFLVQWMMKKYFDDLESLLPDTEKNLKILEAGCGEGEIAGYVAKKYNKQCIIEGFDISKKVILEAKKNYPDVNFFVESIYDFIGGGYKLVLCCEVMEHLEYPEQALKQLERLSEKYIILSVPREPIWRCLNIIRGKYLKKFGNTPGHIQHWSTKGFVDFLTKNGMKIEKIKKPLPWTMVLLKKE